MRWALNSSKAAEAANFQTELNQVRDTYLAVNCPAELQSAMLAQIDLAISAACVLAAGLDPSVPLLASLYGDLDAKNFSINVSPVGVAGEEG